MAALASEGGWMWKSGARSVNKGYKHRFFKVEGKQLQYFKQPGGKKPAGVIDLSTCKDFRKADTSAITDKAVQGFKDNALLVELPKREYVFIPQTTREYTAWVMTIGSLLERRHVSDALAAIAFPSGAAGAAGGSEAAVRARLDSLDSDGPPAALPTGSRPSTKQRSSRTPSVLAEISGLTTQRDVLAQRAADQQAELEALRRGTSSARPGAVGRGGGSLNTSLLDAYEAESGSRVDSRGRLDTPEEEEGGKAVGFCAACNFKVCYNVSLSAGLVLIGAGVLGAAIWAFAYRAAFKQLLGGTDFPLLVAMGVGGGLIAAAALGIYASTRHNTSGGKCLLFIFFIVVVVLIVAQVAASITLLVVAGQVKSTEHVDIAKVQGEGAAVRDITTFLNSTYTTCCLHFDANHGHKECSWLPPVATHGCHPTHVGNGTAIIPFSAWKEDLVKDLSGKVYISGGAWVGIILLQILCAISTFFLFRGGKGCPACCCCLCAMACPACCGSGEEEEEEEERGGRRGRRSKGSRRV